MQTVTAEGLRPSPEGKRRYKIVPIYGANAGYASGLEQMWAERTPEEVVEVLSQPDVSVTNASDKQSTLSALQPALPQALLSTFACADMSVRRLNRARATVQLKKLIQLNERLRAKTA